MLKFRKRPVVIEAFQMTRERRSDNSEWPSWLHRAWNRDPGEGSVWPDPTDPLHERLVIGTLEGIHRVELGDWIIQGITGELYPIRDNIFRETYDEVTKEAAVAAWNMRARAGAPRLPRDPLEEKP